MKGRTHNTRFQTGLSLIEMLIVVSIMSMIALVAIFSYNAYRKNLAVESAVQELSIAIRQAQTYSLSVKETGSSSGQFNMRYGIWIDRNLPSMYYIFADKDGDNTCEYGAGSSCATGDEVIETVTLRDGVVVDDLCFADYNAGWNCSAGGNFSSMAILFRRPRTDATLYLFNLSKNIVGGAKNRAQIRLRMAERTSSVTVDSVGTISVQ